MRGKQLQDRWVLITGASSGFGAAAGGAQGLDTVAEAKDEDWETMLQTNVLGILRMTRAALPLMIRHPGGTIINIGSYAGLKGDAARARKTYEGIRPLIEPSCFSK